MQYLRRRATADAVARDARTVAGLADGPADVSFLAGRLHDGVLVELFRPATQVDDGVYLPREGFDRVVDELNDTADRIESLDRIPIALIDPRRSHLYRRGYRGVDAGDIASTRDARERHREARRREMKLLTGTVSWSIFLGTAAVIAGVALSAPPLLGLGVVLLVSMIPVAIGVSRYFRGVEDRLVEVRYRHEAATLERELGGCTVHVLDRGQSVPSAADRAPR